ncbi:MAG TPA: hypothetical protein VM537_23490 [Anaerolineae bacterium]|nr:hypothetical protein [Anaerolineae bacterium]
MVVSPASEQALLDLQADLDEGFEVMEAYLILEEGGAVRIRTHCT